MTSNYIRSDVAVVGEIAPNNTGVNGDVFVIGCVSNGKLFILLRAKQDIPCVGSDGIGCHNRTNFTARNEYAFQESGVTAYIKMMNDPLIPDVDKMEQNWACDFFKWRYFGGSGASSGSIIFDIFSNPTGTQSAIIYDEDGDPIQSPTITLTVTNTSLDLCDVIKGGADYKTSKKFWQPHFSVKSNSVIFSNTSVFYPGCEDTSTTSQYHPGDNFPFTGTCNNNQTGGELYSNVPFTYQPPGIGKTINTLTKLYAGVTYQLGISDYAYTHGNAVAPEDGDQSKAENSIHVTRTFSPPTFYFGSTTVTGTSTYNGLPNGSKIILTQGDQDYQSYMFTKYGGINMYCGGGDTAIHTRTGNQIPSVEFILIPVSFFNAVNCSDTPRNLIYSYCSTAVNKNRTETDYYRNYCGSNAKTGYTDGISCDANKGNGPYYYPTYCWDVSGNVLNAPCGSTYADGIDPITGCNSIDVNMELTSIFNKVFPTTAVTYNAGTVPCCYRTPVTGEPVIPSDDSVCLSWVQCDEDGLPSGCYWTDPSGNPICKGISTDPNGCVLQCLEGESTLPGCETIECDDFGNPPGCIYACLPGQDPVEDDCYYYYSGDKVNPPNWVCREGDTSFPPGCYDTNVTLLACDANGDPPGCYMACASGENPEDDNCFYYNDGVWFCDADGNGPPGCEMMCSVGATAFTPSGCVPVFCDDYNVDGCIPTCETGDDPVVNGCVYYSNLIGERLCINNQVGYPSGCVQMCTDGGTGPSGGTPAGCQRITCNGDDLDNAACVPLITNPIACTGASDDPAGCVWKSGDDWICQSINNPVGCVYQCVDGSVPSWASDSATSCSVVACTATNIPPGCTASTEPDDNPTDEDSGMLLTIAIIVAVVVGVLLFGGIIYYFVKHHGKSEESGNNKTASTHTGSTQTHHKTIIHEE